MAKKQPKYKPTFVSTPFSSAIDWKVITDRQLYLLQYYGKTAAIRERAKETLLNRAGVKGG